MGMVVRSNIMAVNAQRQLGMNNSQVGKALEQLPLLAAALAGLCGGQGGKGGVQMEIGGVEDMKHEKLLSGVRGMEG